MGERLTTEDLTGRSPATQTDEDARNDQEDARDARTDLDADHREVRAGTDGGPANEPLLDSEEGARFERRWHQVQVAFVDEPRTAVEQADELVAELMRHLAETFADERSRLESAWSAGEDVDTEALRVALTRYRSFFHRLLQP